MKLSKDLLKKYLENKCSEQESQFVQKELLKAENDLLVNNVLEEHWSNAHHNHTLLSDLKKLAILKSIQNKIKTQKTPAKYANTYPMWRWAAAFVALVSIVGAALVSQGDIRQYVIASLTEEVTVPAGKIYTVKLPDGSMVYLNSGSRLTYEKYMWGDSREVHLQGEGFFEVSHDKDRPFIVHANDVHTRVLGTSFNIKAIKEIGVYEITVATGKVQISKGDTVLGNLVPSDRMSINEPGALPLISKVPTHQYRQWQKGMLTFYNQRFTEISWYLENRYGVNIECQGSVLRGCRFTGDFTGMRLNDILKVMREVHDFKITYLHDKIFISGDTVCE